MKTFFLATAAALTIISCNPKRSINKDIIPENTHEINAQNGLFVIDSVKIEDSVRVGKTLNLKTSSKILLFPSLQNKAVLDSIYDLAGFKLNNYSKTEILKELKKQNESYFSQAKEDSNDYMPQYDQTWEENFYMRFISHKNNVLTLTFGSDGYSGGAHGYYTILYKNFDLKKNQTVQLSDVFTDVQKINWDAILSKHFNVEEQKEMLLVDKIPVNDNFYYNDKGITFVYNQYEITAYAAGVVEITVPFAELKSYLKPDFIKRNNIK